jgi:NhaP-type Na+/H+ or K+/H+ antiporter
MPECRKCRVTYHEGESHNCRGIGPGRTSSGGAGVDFLLACVIGAPLGALVSAAVVYLIRSELIRSELIRSELIPSELIRSEAVLAGSMAAGVLVVFMWRRMRRRE